MKLAILLSVVRMEILIREESGTAFAKTDEQTYFYMDSKRVKLNILRPSPRSLLQASDYSQCNQHLNNYCDWLFETFDEEITNFLNLNLVKKLRKSAFQQPSNKCPFKNPNPYFEGKWCCSSSKERIKPIDENWAKRWSIKVGDKSCDGSTLSNISKCCSGRSVKCSRPPCRPAQKRVRKSTADALHRHALLQLDQTYKTPPNTTRQHQEHHRIRRVVPIVAQFMIVIAIAISAYFIGESVVESDISNVQDDILHHEKALKSLTNAVGFDHETLSSVVNQIRVDPELVLAPNVTSIPTYYMYMKSKTTHADFQPNRNVRKYQNFYPAHISQLSIDEAKVFEENVLQLQNNRLPLNKNFLIALRAKCLAIQTVSSTLAQTFCNDLAFHATRWDTGLKFEGIGFELDDAKKIKSTVYSMEIEIPVLYDGGLDEYVIYNLGRFQAANQIRKIPLPDNAVITAAGDIRPLNTHTCMQMNNYKICPKHAVGPFSSCLQSIFQGKISTDCSTIDIISPSTCTSRIIENSMAISMFGNGTMHFDLGKGDLLLKPEPVKSFTILQRRATRGTLFCMQSKHKHITPDLVLPRIDEKLETAFEIIKIPSFHADLEHLQPLDKKLHSMRLQLLRANQSLNQTKRMLEKSNNRTSSTLSNFKNHMHNSINKVEEKVGSMYNDIILKILLPVVVPIFSILVLLAILRRTKKNNGVKLRHSQNSKRNSQQDAIISESSN